MPILNPKQPLWMPPGSVRAIIAGLIVTPFVFIALKSGVVLTGDQFVGVLTLVLSAYFISKSASDAASK